MIEETDQISLQDDTKATKRVIPQRVVRITDTTTEDAQEEKTIGTEGDLGHQQHHQNIQRGRDPGTTRTQTITMETTTVVTEAVNIPAKGMTTEMMIDGVVEEADKQFDAGLFHTKQSKHNHHHQQAAAQSHT